MKYSDLEAILKTVLPDATFHLSAPPDINRYIIWAETGTRTLRAGNKISERIYLANVYVYTQSEDDSLLEDVCAALEAVENVAVGDPVPAYDDELLTMGWILECEVI